MNNLRKAFRALIVIVFIVGVVAFIIKVKPINAAFAQSPKSTNSSIKVEKKRIITPNQARNFLNDLDMPTRDYVDTWGPNRYGKYEADSDRFILETRDPNRYLNNLTYSVFGDKHVAKAVQLDLNVNDVSFSSNAVSELIKYSNGLMFKVTGKNLPPEIKKTMQAKNSGEWIIDGYKIKLKAEIFPDEKSIKGVESTSDHGAFSLEFLIEL